MSTRIVEAVMHCTQKEPDLVIDTGISVRDNLYSPAGVALYPTPPVDEATLAGQVDAADAAQGNAKISGKTGTATRDAAIFALHTSLHKLLLYVNGLYRGNKANLEASGFGTSKDPSPHGIPDEPVIKRIEDGPVAHSAKIFLAKTTSTLDKQKESVTYYVQMAPTNLEASYVTVLEVKDSRELLITGLTRGVEQFFRVAKSNAAGKSPFSTPVAFIPQ